MTISPDLPPIQPDDKDWTYVIADGCAQCGYRPHPVGDTAARIRATVPGFARALALPTSRQRPAPTTWSSLEYGCHVRDVADLFRQRLDLMLAEDDPQFANWDQDQTAVQSRYAEQDPAVVAAEYAVAAEANAAAWDAVDRSQWARPSRRSNGSVFTVETFARYLVHDLEHHHWDVRSTG